MENKYGGEEDEEENVWIPIDLVFDCFDLGQKLFNPSCNVSTMVKVVDNYVNTYGLHSILVEIFFTMVEFLLMNYEIFFLF